MTQAYKDWVAAGGNWTACKPARDLKALLIEMGVNKFSIGTIGDVEGHLKDATPEDHTPFSVDQDGMGRYYRKGYVMAIDVPHDPKRGIHCGEIAERIIADKPSWFKYLIWNGPKPAGYRDRRNAYKRLSRPGHDKHMHISFWAGSEEATVDWAGYVSPSVGAEKEIDPMAALTDTELKDLYKKVKDIHWTLTNGTPEHVRDKDTEARDKKQDDAIAKVNGDVAVLTTKVDQILGSVNILAGEYNSTHQDVEGKGATDGTA